MRILWLSNASWVGSGYGQQTSLFVPRLQALGHELAVASNYGVHGTQMDWRGVTIYPSDNDWGNSALSTYVKHHRADLVIALCDAWVLKPQMWPDDVLLAAWAPLDHHPVPPMVKLVLSHPNVRTIAMSRFGERAFDEASLEPAYVPHGVDTDVFTPKPEMRDVVRDGFGIPRDAFLVGMVGANKGNASLPRKAFPQAFDAFARFAEQHDDAWMYVHTDARPHYGGGLNLDRLAEAVGCPAGKIRFPSADVFHLGAPHAAIAAFYQAFDVLLNPSMGEGFGVPVIEAQACGCPVITADHSAMPELTHAGWVVGGDRWWDELQETFLIVPSIAGIEAALEDAYARREDTALREAARDFALGYDADLVTDAYWKPALEQLVAPRVVPPLTNRAQRRALAKAR